MGVSFGPAEWTVIVMPMRGGVLERSNLGFRRMALLEAGALGNRWLLWAQQGVRTHETVGRLSPQLLPLNQDAIALQSGHALQTVMGGVKAMTKLKQTFANATDATLFLNLELSTSRYRLKPGEELILFYDPKDRDADSNGAALRIELITGGDGLELVIYTGEQEMFLPDGREAPLDFCRA